MSEKESFTTPKAFRYGICLFIEPHPISLNECPTLKYLSTICSPQHSLKTSAPRPHPQYGVYTLQGVAQPPFRSLKRISDHSKVRFTANPKLVLRAQTLGWGRFTSLRMVSRNSLMFAPGIWATARLPLTHNPRYRYFLTKSEFLSLFMRERLKRLH